MTQPVPSPFPVEPARHSLDFESLQLVQYVLEQAEYSTRMDFLTEKLQALIAEDATHLVLVVATTTVDGLLALEPIVTSHIVGLLRQERLASKRWDAYAILLTGQLADEGSVDAIFGITYNLRQVRRVVKVGVEPTIAAMGRALRTVLPMTSQAAPDLLIDPLNALEAQLLTDGAEPILVRESLADFRSGFQSASIELQSGEETNL